MHVKALKGLETFAWRDRQCVRLGFLGRDKRSGHEHEFRPLDISLKALDEKAIVLAAKMLQVGVIQTEVLALALWQLELLQVGIG